MKRLNQTEKKIIEILKQDPVKNVNLINFIRFNPVQTIISDNGGVLVRGVSYHNWVYISCYTPEQLMILLEYLNDCDTYYAIIESWMIPYIIKDKEIKWKLTCNRLFLPESTPLPQLSSKIVPIRYKDADYIFNNYSYCGYVSLKYIRERIKQGFALGIYHEKKPIAWIMTHDDGAMGCINVLPQYRRQGLGLDLTIALANQLRDKSEKVFVHIEESKTESMALANKLGFIHDREVSWLAFNKEN